MNNFLQMMKKSALILFFCWFCLPLYSQNLYDIENITTIEITFPTDDWDAILDTYYANDAEERLVGTCVINGMTFENVGVAFKGNSTYNPTNLKNPLNIKIDHIVDQKYQGYTSLRLSNGNKDPSFVREVLSYEIGRNYMDMPLSNYAKVTINGEYYGLFSSTEGINGDYHERRLFCDDDNTRVKCNPVSVFDGGSSLEYLGTDSADYYDFYELKSDYGWADLIDFTSKLQTDVEDIETVLDVDRALWMLAFNSVLVNLDSYTGPFQQNYYLIKDDEGRFLPIVWDLNQSLGSFALVDDGGGPGGPTDLTDLTEMDFYLREDDSSFPLIQQLLSIPRYRKMYTAHGKTMYEEFFQSGIYVDRAEALQDVIATEVGLEPNGFYTVAEFSSNLTSEVGGGGMSVYGISQVMEPRVDYFETLTEFGYTAPTISSVETSVELPLSFSTVAVTAFIEDANFAQLCFRDKLQGAFSKVQLFDDGLHGDDAAGDGVYGAFIELDSKDIQYYIYAENELAAKFSPRRAEHEFYNLTIGSPVVINELMAKNEVSVADQDGAYEDWIELYNNTTAAIDLSGYYLSDDPIINPTKWKIPDGTIIEGNDYLIVWADSDTTETGLHANFKLSASGESVSLSTPDGLKLSTVTFPELGAETTYGRFENGTGPVHANDTYL